MLVSPSFSVDDLPEDITKKLPRVNDFNDDLAMLTLSKSDFFRGRTFEDRSRGVSKGAWGTVFRLKQEPTDAHPMAVKAVLINNNITSAQFAHEVHVMSELRSKGFNYSPAIDSSGLLPYGIERDRGRERLLYLGYIAMEAFPVDVFDFFKRVLKNNSVQTAERYIQPFVDLVSTAFEDLHAMGLAHMDANARNVMLKKVGNLYEPRIIDYERSRRIEGDSLRSYPFQHSNLTDVFDPKEDIYFFIFHLNMGLMDFVQNVADAPRATPKERAHYAGVVTSVFEKPSAYRWIAVGSSGPAHALAITELATASFAIL